jgi:hypothetical protein
MNRLQQFALDTTARFVPQLRALFESAGGTISALSEELSAARSLMHQRESGIGQLREEAREAEAMTGGGVWRGKERLTELELAVEDRGWQRLLALSEQEFSRYGLQQIIKICRLYYIKNPLIRRGVSVSSNYVFGRGFEIRSDDEAENQALQEFLTDRQNSAEIGHAGMVMKEIALNTDGNLFFVLFSDPSSGRVLVRTIDALEVNEIVTDPDDHSQPWFYHRVWSQQSFDATTGVVQSALKEAWYPALDFEPNGAGRQRAIAGKPVLWDQPILHVKVGGLPKWHFGCPLVYPAIDWARAYKNFLEDWATITRSLARFTWDVQTKGGQQAINALKTALATTLGNDDGTAIETNPAPTVASSFISGPGNKLTPVKTAGATTEPEQGRRVMLMVAAALGLPETFFGDATAGSLATAKSLDRPTELAFLGRQEQWREVLLRISRYALDQSGSAPNGKLREARKALAKQGTITVDFPEVLEHDTETRVGAIVDGLTLKGQLVNGIDEKTGIGLILTELGVENVQAVLDAMYPQGKYDPNRMVKPEPAAVPPPAVNGKPQSQPKSTQEAIDRGVAELQRALAKLQERRS